MRRAVLVVVLAALTVVALALAFRPSRARVPTAPSSPAEAPREREATSSENELALPTFIEAATVAAASEPAPSEEGAVDWTFIEASVV